MELARNDYFPSLFPRSDLWGRLHVGDFKRSVKEVFEYDPALMQEFIFMYFGYGSMSFERMRVYRILFLNDFPKIAPDVFWIPAVEFCKERGPNDALRSLGRDEDVTDVFETLYRIDERRLLNDCVESREVFDTFAEAIARSKMVSRDFLEALSGAEGLPRAPLSKCVGNVSDRGKARDVAVAYERGVDPRVHLVGEYGERARQLDVSALLAAQLDSGEPGLNIRHAVGIGEFLYILSEMGSLYAYDPNEGSAMRLDGLDFPIRGICRCGDSLLALDYSGALASSADPLRGPFVRLNCDVVSLANFSRVFLDCRGERIMVTQVLETEPDVKLGGTESGKRVIFSEIFSSGTRDETGCEDHFGIARQIRIEHDAGNGSELGWAGFFEDGDISLICGNGETFLLSFVYENDEVPVDNEIACVGQNGTILKKNGEIRCRNRTIAFVPDLDVSRNLALTSLPLLSYECFSK